MSTISIQLTVGTVAATAPIASTTVVVTDSGGAAQTFTLNGTESPVGFIPSVTVAAGTGSVVITDLDANGATLGTAVTVPYTTGAVGGTQFLHSGATVVTLTT
jgi:hypothetical protein